MVKLLHAADLHLDSPFAGLPPEQAARRRAGQRHLAAGICHLAGQRGCQLLLLAGDIFDALHPYPETLEALQTAFAACPAEIFIAPGNHDYWTADGPWRGPWPKNVHIFRSNEIEAVPLPHLGCTAYGAAFTGPEAPGLLEGFHTDAPHAVMVLHGDAEQKNSVYGPVTTAQIAASGLEYLALGHIHSRSGLRQAGQTWFAWPGCPEGRGFDECGPKGILEVRLDEAVSASFLPLPGARYENRTLEAGDDPAAQILAALPPSTTLHARVTLTGEAVLDAQALAAQLEDQYASLQIDDATTAPRSLWDGAEETTLRGLFLADLHSQWQAADEDRKTLIQEAARLGLAALDGREVQEK